MTEYSIPTANSVPEGITWGPDGNLWFTEEAGKIARITTAGTITEYSTPAGVSPGDIALGADGNLWFTELNENKIGRSHFLPGVAFPGLPVHKVQLAPKDLPVHKVRLEFKVRRGLRDPLFSVLSSL